MLVCALNGHQRSMEIDRFAMTLILLIPFEPNRTLISFSSPGNFIGNQDAAMRDTTIPQVVRALTGHPIEDIAVGCEYVLALDRVGNIWSWGANNEGQLGVGNINPQYIPVLVATVVGKNMSRISAGIIFSFNFENFFIFDFFPSLFLSSIYVFLYYTK